MHMEKGNLVIDGQIYEKEVKPPALSKIIRASKEERLKLSKIKVGKGNSIKKEGSTFTGYVTMVRTVQEVNEAYCKVKSTNLSVRHIICAFRIPHPTEAHTHKDYQDDDEYAAGRILLAAMKNSEITHRAIFVVRDYDSQHIGPDRFEGILEVAKSVMTMFPYNTLTGKNELLWTNERNRKFTDKNPRNKMNLRGGRGVMHGQGGGKTGGYSPKKKQAENYPPLQDPDRSWAEVVEKSPPVTSKSKKNIYI